MPKQRDDVSSQINKAIGEVTLFIPFLVFDVKVTRLSGKRSKFVMQFANARHVCHVADLHELKGLELLKRRASHLRTQLLPLRTHAERDIIERLQRFFRGSGLEPTQRQTLGKKEKLVNLLISACWRIT